MKTYHPPGWEPISVFEQWLVETGEQLGLGAITVEQFGVGALLAELVLIALVLTLRSRNASSGEPVQKPEPKQPGCHGGRA